MTQSKREQMAVTRATWWALLAFALLVLVLAAVAPWISAASRRWLYGTASFVGVGIVIGHDILSDWFAYQASPIARLRFAEWLKLNLLCELPGSEKP